MIVQPDRKDRNETEHGIEWEQKGTHEKHLSLLDFEK